MPSASYVQRRQFSRMNEDMKELILHPQQAQVRRDIAELTTDKAESFDSHLYSALTKLFSRVGVVT